MSSPKSLRPLAVSLTVLSLLGGALALTADAGPSKGDPAKGKPIYTYPTEMKPAGDLQFTAQVKEPLVDELRKQTIERGIKPEVRFLGEHRGAEAGAIFAYQHGP